MKSGGIPETAFLEQKIITCILPKGRANPVLKVLYKECGLTAVDIHYARGSGRITPLRYRGIGETSEKEILTVAVPADEADEMFEYIYELAEINQPHGGLMYMQALKTSTRYELPDLPEED
jgi:nitrogen regulatory protein PII